MKKFLIFFLVLFAGTATFAKTVKFSVNMTGQVVDITGVHITGDFQDEAGFAGGDWIPNTALMTQEANDTNMYSVIVNIPAFRVYEFKFINGDATYQVEFVPQESRVLYNFDDNRWIYVDSLSNDTQLVAPVVFGMNAPTGKYLLRFRVDMQNEASISSSGAHVAGDFQGFDPSQTRLYSFDGDIYEYIAYVDTGFNSLVHEFKYANGNTTGNYETVPGTCAVNSNRGTTVPKDTMLAVVCYSACVDCQSVGMNEFAPHNSISLYPNPTSDFTMVEFNDGKTFHEITVTDIYGRVIDTYTSTNPYQRIDKDELETGVYFINVTTGNSGRVSMKWVVK